MVLRTNLGIIQEWLILPVVGRCYNWFLPQPVVIWCNVVRFMDQCDAVFCFRCVSSFPL